MKKLTYESAGVSIERGDNLIDKFSEYIKTQSVPKGLISGIGGFAACFNLKEILSQMEDPCLVTCCDGVGTKLKLALDWNYIDFLGYDLVAMNVNDLICTGAFPSLFLDYFASGKILEELGLSLLKSIHKACSFAGCYLVGGETAEMPGIYNNKDFDLAGFAIGFLDRKKMLGADKVKINDVVLGIESSGIHSNGYSLIRKIVNKEKIKPESFPNFDSTRTWKEILLAPTIIYSPYIVEIYDKIHALAHITGGGLFGNLPRVLPSGTKAVIYSINWPKNELFNWVKACSSLSNEEMLSTFNCGIGLIAVLPEKDLLTVKTHLKHKGLNSFELGQIVPSNGNEIEWV